MRRIGEIVDVTCSDGVRLQSFHQLAGDEPNLTQPLVVIGHGVCGNFYSSSLLDVMANEILERGYDCLRVNFRGRDSVCFHSTLTGYTRHGSAFESMQDGVTDYEAYFEWSQSFGYKRIGCVAHSLGALKTVLWTSEKLHRRANVQFQILLSPPRFERHSLRPPKRAGGFDRDIAAAVELVNQAKHDHLIRVSHPFPMLISAATFLDKYDSDSKFDYVERIAAISDISTLWTFGSRETSDQESTFRNADKNLIQHLDDLPNHQCKVVEAGDHNYTRARKSLLSIVRNWLDNLTDVQLRHASEK